MNHTNQLIMFVCHSFDTYQWEGHTGASMTIFGHHLGKSSSRHAFVIRWRKQQDDFKFEWGGSAYANDYPVRGYKRFNWTDRAGIKADITEFVNNSLDEEYCKQFMQYIAGEKYPVY